MTITVLVLQLVTWLYLVFIITFCHCPCHIPFALGRSWFFTMYGWGDPNFIYEESRPLVVLPEFSSCNFPLTLITKYGNTKKHPEGISCIA